ncbi:hypothetical protein [Actinomyces trachealis]|uniref:hypothetical protein n=1 Tax=Actinomyces trachealis TaxID=2763540 RepID=UPI001892C7DA|nr:hypothetical protein [Actinomyces trachealis]
MAGPDLKVTDADFDNAIEGLAHTKNGFESMKSVGDELASAVGHRGLATACTDFISQWSVNRDRIQRAINEHLELLRKTKQAFDQAEQNATQGPSGGGSSQSAPNGGGKTSPGDNGQTSSGNGGGQPAPFGGGSGGSGVSTVSGGGGGASLGGTDIEPNKGVNQVGGAGGGASLGGTETDEHRDVNEVDGGASPQIDNHRLPSDHKDPNRIDDTPANAAIKRELEAKGLPVFVVDGQVQRPLGKVDGIGTLLGSQDEPPTISAVVDSNGRVVDIADLKPEYDEKGNLVGLNQVPVKPVDLTATQPGYQGDEGKVPGVVDGSAPKTPVLDSRTQEAVNKVKELFGDLVEVALSGGAAGGDPTLTVAGVSGIGLAALATLATLSRSGGADTSTMANVAEGHGSLRDSFSDIVPESKDSFGQRQATDREQLIDTLLKDLYPELGPKVQDSGSSGADLREALAGTVNEDSGSGSALSADASAFEELPDNAGESLRASLARTGPSLKGDLGDALPAGTGSEDYDSLTASTGGASSGTAGDLGSALPGGVSHQSGVADSDSASGTSAEASVAMAREETSKERRNAHMMGGMGMAAGISAAGGRGGLTGAEEARRNEEARRLRDRLASSKEND